jgi:hypothetical protein
MAAQSASTVRAAVLRKSPFSLAKAFSIGLLGAIQSRPAAVHSAERGKPGHLLAAGVLSSP